MDISRSNEEGWKGKLANAAAKSKMAPSLINWWTLFSYVVDRCSLPNAGC
jgi:hypothetical protein